MENVGGNHFQMHYRTSQDLVEQGLFSQALECLLVASRCAKSEEEKLSFEVMRLSCMQLMGFSVTEVLNKFDCLSMTSEQRQFLAVMRARNFFREGEFDKMIEVFRENSSAESKYISAWVTSLPYSSFDQVNLSELLSEVGAYRMQTLTGKSFHGHLDAAATWSQRSERLYLWTWRWLVEPSTLHDQALVSVLSEFDAWPELDGFSIDDMQMIHNSLAWILIFEPQQRVRWSRLIRKVSNFSDESAPVFCFERLAQSWIRQAIKRDVRESARAEKTFKNHSLYRQLRMAPICEALVPKKAYAIPNFTILPESGQIYEKNKIVVRSQSLANLFAALTEQGEMTFADALLVSYQISPYDSGIHDSKIQNLIVRLRKILGTHAKIVTKGRWIFLQAGRTKIQVGANKSRARLSFLKSQMNLGSTEKPSPLRNERNISLLLKELVHLGGEDITRAELEKKLKIPKASLNRYLRVWIERGWIKKSGAGRCVSYRRADRISFFES